MYFWIFMTVLRYFFQTFLETAMIFPNMASSAELHTTSRNSLRDLRRSFPKLRRNLARFSVTRKTSNLLRASLSFHRETCQIWKIGYSYLNSGCRLFFSSCRAVCTLQLTSYDSVMSAPNMPETPATGPHRSQSEGESHCNRAAAVRAPGLRRPY